MFTRRQPREIYRVYGEDELFADDSPVQLDHAPVDHGPVDHAPDDHGSFDLDHGPVNHAPVDNSSFDQPIAAVRETPTATHDPVPAFAPLYAQGPVVASEDVPLAHRAPLYAQGPAVPSEDFPPAHHAQPNGHNAHEPEPPWSLPADGVAHQDPYGSLPPRSPLLARRQRRSGGRVLGIAALCAVLGLLLGLLAVNALRPGQGASAPHAQTQPASRPSHSHVSAPARASAAQKAPAPAHRRHRAHHRSPAPRRRAPNHEPARARRPVRRASSSAPVAGQPRSQGVVSAPVAPASESVATYVPPSTSSGPEFGFER